MFTRHCPGSHLVESSMWLLMVTMLATFDMSKPIDEYGHTIEPDVQFNDSVFRYVVLCSGDLQLIFFYCTGHQVLSNAALCRDPSKW